MSLVRTLFATNKVVAKRNARASFFIAMSPHEVIVLWNGGAWKKSDKCS
jgi:hypothetical protein